MQTDFRTSYLLVETINKLGEIKTVTARGSLFLLVEIEFLADGNIFSLHFRVTPASDQQQSTAASGSSFSFNWNIFFTLDPSFRLVETCFLSAGNSIFFILRFFLLGETITKISGSQFLQRTIFLLLDTICSKIFQSGSSFSVKRKRDFQKLFHPASRNEFSVSWRQFFYQSYFSASRNHYWNYWKTVFKERTYSS